MITWHLPKLQLWMGLFLSVYIHQKKIQCALYSLNANIHNPWLNYSSFYCFKCPSECCLPRYLIASNQVFKYLTCSHNCQEKRVFLSLKKKKKNRKIELKLIHTLKVIFISLWLSPCWEFVVQLWWCKLWVEFLWFLKSHWNRNSSGCSIFVRNFHRS